MGLFPEDYSTPKAVKKANMAEVAERNDKLAMADKLLEQACEAEAAGE